MTASAARCAAGYVARHFPAARGSVLAGSALTAAATTTSDLDIVVVHDDGPVLRRTDVHEGRTVEAFVHTPASLRVFLDREVAARRSPLLHMCAEGRPLVDIGGWMAALRRDCARRLAEGPPPLSVVEDEDRRYAITDVLDDLAGGPDPDELAFLAARLLSLLAELVLLQDRRWLGTGKWLVRRLRRHDPDAAALLLDGHRRTVAGIDPGPLHTAGAGLLARRGGRVQAGYVRRAFDADLQQEVQSYGERGAHS